MRLLLFFLSVVILCFGQRSEPPAGSTQYIQLHGDGDSECAEDEFHIGGKCVEEWNTRLCNGSLIHHGDLCNGCSEKWYLQVIINGKCVRKDLTWQCDGFNTLKESACNGKCDYHRVNINDKCVWKSNTRLCNGVPIMFGDLCDECIDGQLKIDGNCVWKINTHLCKGVPILLTDSCEGECDGSYVILNNKCVRKRYTYLCNGVPILLKASCEGECVDGRIKIDGNCVDKKLFQLCNGSYISSGDICFGECDQEYVKFHGRCVRLCADGTFPLSHHPCNGCKGGWAMVRGMCLMKSDTYICNNQRLFIEDVCDEKCNNGRIWLGGKCISLEDTWTCQGRIQAAVEPCSGKCLNRKLYNFRMPDNDNEEILMDYIICGEKCLLRTEAWDCKGTCQPQSVPCDGQCLTLAPDIEQYYYDNIGGTCVLAQRIPNPYRGSAGSRSLYSSGITGISGRQSLAQLGVIWSCPPTHCRSGLKCCKLVINGGLKCPSFC
eukprot:GFUD01087231.1.p1 GENE.GFUD01087231.1~~GFUD01087231.1.p1  ORF type:complete len:491 (+),score=36.36 GFUD01087231.1:102-1574(+)